MKLPKWSGKLAFTAMGFLLVLAGWTLWRRPPRAERVYQQLLQEFNWGVRVKYYHSTLPPGTARILRLGTIDATLDQRVEQLMEELTKLGFMTNAVLPLTGLGPDMTNDNTILAEAERRLKNTVMPIGGFMAYSISKTNLRITCLSSNFPLIQATVSKP